MLNVHNVVNIVQIVLMCSANKKILHSLGMTGIL